MAVLSVVLSLLGHLVARMPLVSMSSLVVAATVFYALIALIAIGFRAKRDRIIP